MFQKHRLNSFSGVSRQQRAHLIGSLLLDSASTPLGRRNVVDQVAIRICSDLVMPNAHYDGAILPRTSPLDRTCWPCIDAELPEHLYMDNFGALRNTSFNTVGKDSQRVRAISLRSLTLFSERSSYFSTSIGSILCKYTPVYRMMTPWSGGAAPV